MPSKSEPVLVPSSDLLQFTSKQVSF